MVFAVFAPLALVVLRLSVRWPWRLVVLAAVVVGLAADLLLDSLVAFRRG